MKKFIQHLLCLFIVLALSYPTHAIQNTEDLIRKASQQPQNHLEELFTSLMTSESSRNAMLLTSLKTNAKNMLTPEVNRLVLEWLRNIESKPDFKTAVALMLIRFCVPLDPAKFKKEDIQYERARNKTEALLAGLALGDTKALRLIEEKLHSSNKEEVAFALELLNQTQYESRASIPLDLFQDALKLDDKQIPVEAFIQQVFEQGPVDSATRLSFAFSRYPKIGHRLSSIVGVADVMSSNNRMKALVTALKSYPEVLLFWAGDVCCTYSYNMSRVMDVEDNPNWAFDLLVKNAGKDKYIRENLLMMGTAMDRTGLDSFVNIPESPDRFKYGHLSEKCDFLYTLRCGNKQNRSNFAQALRTLEVFPSGVVFLQAAMLPPEQRNQMIEEFINKHGDATFMKRAENRLCIAHLPPDGNTELKWKAFTYLTNLTDDSKGHDLLIRDLKGKISFDTIMEQIRRKCNSYRIESILLPELQLITEQDLVSHKQELEQTVGHYGLQAKTLADRLLLAGDNDYLWFYFASFD